MRFLSTVVLSVVLAAALCACSDDSGKPDGPSGPDMAVTDSQVGPDSGPGPDAAPSQDQGGDQGTTADQGAAVTCTTGGGQCTGSALSCECCGSMGPAPICLCSKPCALDTDCQGTGLPLCNKASGADAGICTPNGFNCCWFCQ